MANLEGDLLVMKTLNIKPNFSELARIYDMDYRTIKKKYDGVENKKVGRKEESFWDKYRQDIEDLLSQKGITKKAIYQ